MRLSFADIFSHNTNYQPHGYLFYSVARILKVQNKNFCRRDGTYGSHLHINSPNQGFSYETQDSVLKPGFQLLSQGFNRFAH